jgi:hypothetical protein
MFVCSELFAFFDFVCLQEILQVIFLSWKNMDETFAQIKKLQQKNGFIYE